MTDRERAIVMAHAGICMLTGDKFQIFHKYVEEIMGRPIMTHEMGIKSIADEIRSKSKDDFIALCADESSSKNPNKWIPVSERLPEENGRYLAYIENSYYNRLSYIMICDYVQSTWCPDDETASNNVTYWMPLPAKPHKEEEIIEMTYGEIYEEFCKKCPDAEVSDYRPAMPQYLPWLVKPIPYAIVVWLKDGTKVVYIAEGEE